MRDERSFIYGTILISSAWYIKRNMRIPVPLESELENQQRGRARESKIEKSQIRDQRQETATGR